MDYAFITVNLLFHDICLIHNGKEFFHLQTQICNRKKFLLQLEFDVLSKIKFSFSLVSIQQLSQRSSAIKGRIGFEETTESYVITQYMKVVLTSQL